MWKSVPAVTYDNYDEVISDSEKPVLIDFWAPWCHPCRTMEPVLGELVDTMKDKLNFAKVNIDLYHDIAEKFSVRSIPTLLLVKNNNEVLRLNAGKYTLSHLDELLGDHLN